jgi:putative ABC transport system permease protein
MLGIIIGVGAVIAVISIASGSQQQVTSRISDMGSNLINIRPGYSIGRFGQFSSSAEDIFTLELGEGIVAYCPAVKSIAPNSQATGYFMVGDNNYRASIIGTTMDYLDINIYYPETGKFFSQFDLDNATSVIVLGSELVEELYEGKNPVGSKITFYYNNQPLVFRIIGVMEEKERGITGDLNGSAYIPITTYLNKISTGKYVDSFVAQANSSEEANLAVEQIEYLLTKYIGDEEKFDLISQDQLLDTISEVTGTMTLMLSGIAAISLLVGGIGIMNIMLVSVTERTREIGIRKALGAKRRHVLSQFLIEALTLSSIGGIVGIFFGYTAAYGVARLGGWPLDISIPTVTFAFAFSLIVGIFFGIYPAVKASKLDPVIALSYE